ncbi:UvrD-helicase domain-containing protein [Pigmentiphaga litoralis]|uniref:RecBCD enzyme subunit RecB n=1 Tax=Pigmentiphaga litoralis TaxID=516702 RepID=A0A7Y9IVJ9_9BURK|nr:UvrD-helicase domain-containing protein [Pigmentiphaga litoralis]NYE22513.1 ATP-dependent exoDNAse (exonuclease V) beta subunit [Pigmentiphaga litoralis]NYE83872.1 ATP-dependent exoDNAse (exonuclease V) beta subunit [Pigmentiphaga litoralis]
MTTRKLNPANRRHDADSRNDADEGNDAIDRANADARPDERDSTPMFDTPMFDSSVTEADDDAPMFPDSQLGSAADDEPMFANDAPMFGGASPSAVRDDGPMFPEDTPMFPDDGSAVGRDGGDDDAFFFNEGDDQQDHDADDADANADAYADPDDIDAGNDDDFVEDDLSDAPLALRFPLQGSRLIEASAGTGKTFTISALYVRLVLGHGGPGLAFPREMAPPDILVMTFTDAATQELRDRIRARLAQTARFFREEIAAPDPLMARLRAGYPRSAWPGNASKLDIAAQWMDEAAVSTIHGWCQRMLREHAFDSGSLFTQTLATDHTDLLADVVRDYWRQHCYGLTGTALDWVEANWKTPDTLRAKVTGLLGATEPSTHLVPLGDLIAQTLEERRRHLADLKAPWAAWMAELMPLIESACAAKQVDGRKLQVARTRGWCDLVTAWATTPEVDVLDIKTGFERLTTQGIADVWKSGTPLTHPALDAMPGLQRALASLPQPDTALLRHAAQWVRHRFDQEKRRRAEMGFDDMLQRLDDALHGENGDRLADLIRTQFPVAMVDEFQDTDPVQYRIFDKVYQVEQNRDDCALLMIGDPKQAIYAFRGADIFTYLRARSATEGRHASLDTNFRSTHAMVAAVNRVFGMAEDRPAGRGAFLFRRGSGNPVPFLSVAAAGRKEGFTERGALARAELEPGGLTRDAGRHSAAMPANAAHGDAAHGDAAHGDAASGNPTAGHSAALTVWHMASDAPVGSGGYRHHFAGVCATEIVRLLNLSSQGEAGFARDNAPGSPLTPLRPADIAILVRDFAEARAIRSALSQRGVRSVYLSDKDSVFDGQEASDVLAWLKACAEPDLDRPLRAALATRTLALPLAALERINQDERHWEDRVMQFRQYRGLWRKQGVLPMLRRLLHDFDLPRALMQRPDGERVLTNLLHLAELLQQAASELDGEQAVIRHLADHLGQPGQTAEEQVLRLESDEQLVRVVTVHKSKGLEYPLVFLPFVCAFKPVDPARPPVRFHDAQGKLVVRTAPDADDVARADDERLAEDLRLLYVALTRAQHACWLGVADLKRRGDASVLHRSALGYLLGGGDPLPHSGALAQWLDELTKVSAESGDVVSGGAVSEDTALPPPALAHPALRVVPAPEVTRTFLHQPQIRKRAPDVRRPQRSKADHWWIASYSALTIADQRVASDDGFDSAMLDAGPDERAVQDEHLAHIDQGRAMEAGERGAGTGAGALGLEGAENDLGDDRWARDADPSGPSGFDGDDSSVDDLTASDLDLLAFGDRDADFGDPQYGDLSPDTPEAQKAFDDDVPDAGDALNAAYATGNPGVGLHGFPRGPNPGTFLHGLLEWAGDEGFGTAAADRAALVDAVARRCNRRGWEAWIQPLSDWLAALLVCPLPTGAGAPVKLSGLDAYQVEMEFWFQSTRVDVTRLDALVRRHTLGGAPRAPANPALLNGMFKGFIDLVFEHDGRYYVADYKSNWLGDDDAAYTQDAMRKEMLKKRYDLQYVLYLLALHRQLKVRLPDYDYDRHVGGALYLFLRGSRAPSKGAFHTRPPRALIEALDALFAGRSLTGVAA